MTRESFKSFKRIMLALLFLLSITVHAEVISCTENIALSTNNAELSTEEVQQETEKNSNTKQKTKGSSSYFGMFKLLIPDTLR
jgi:hypothetical protein